MNDTSFDWTAYQPNVYVNNYFKIFAQAATLPRCAATVTQMPVCNGSQYEGQTLFTSSASVMVGGELHLSCTVTFSVATLYSFTQEMIPVLEPGTSGFLAVGVLLGATLAAGRRKSQS